MKEIDKNSKFNAGGKARWDVTKVLERIPNIIPITFNYSPKSKLLVLINLIKFERQVDKRVKANDFLIIQNQFRLFPLSFSMFHRFKKRHISIVFIVHDLRGLRTNNFKFDKKEMELFDETFLIVHTNAMKSYVLSKSKPLGIGVLDIFPYILTLDNQRKILPFDSTVFCYAGNLDKSSFLLQIPEKFRDKFSIYGQTSSPFLYKKFQYKGAFSSDVIPLMLVGKFGLIWDGNSLNGCKGTNKIGINADYIRYNSPHKLSLYIASGIPVICWEKSGIAQFVKNKKIGVCISSITELFVPSFLEKINYDELRKNVGALEKSVVNGDCLFFVLRELIGFSFDKK
jgi:hypothetical protein